MKSIVNATTQQSNGDGGKNSIKTLLGYRIHLAVINPALPASKQEEQFPYAAIFKLIRQGGIKLTEGALLKLLGGHANATVVLRLKRLRVSQKTLLMVGEQLLTECFEAPALQEALSSGYIGKPLQKADTLIQSLSLPKDLVARCFMGDPQVWGAFPDCASDDTTSFLPAHHMEVGYLTRQARACADGSSLPWVTWQWAIKTFGSAHLVCSACLHDVCLRPLPRLPPSQPTPSSSSSSSSSSSTHTTTSASTANASAFLNKESDAAARAMVAAGVRVPFCTIVTALRRVLEEIEIATASGEAMHAMRVKASKLSGELGREARRMAESADFERGVKSVSRKYVVLMADVEKALLGLSPQADESVQQSSMALAARLEQEQKRVRGRSAIKRLPVFPAVLYQQDRSMWLIAFREYVLENVRWKALSSSNIAPNACRRFYIAMSNMVRALEQFGSPAAALAALKAKKGTSSLSSLAVEENFLFTLWSNELKNNE